MSLPLLRGGGGRTPAPTRTQSGSVHLRQRWAICALTIARVENNR